jgi:hypothetical protein
MGKMNDNQAAALTKPQPFSFSYIKTMWAIGTSAAAGALST